ncbi:MAG: hypothetical protein AAGK04_08860 [Planctomycetota bacterium]
MLRKAITLFAAACVTVTGTTALAQNDPRADQDQITRYWFDQTTPKAAPAPQPAAAPTAAPAPRRVGYSSTGAFTIHNNEGRVHSAYPTGEASGGAIHVEKLLPAEISAGENFEYLIVATSLIDGEIHNVNICDQLSNNFQVVSAEPNPQSTSGNRYCWNLGNFGPRERKVIRITGSASGGESLNSCATVDFDLPLCAESRITTPQLTLEMNAPQQICKCDPFPISYVVCNPGTGVARDVVVSQQLPAGLTVNGSNTVTQSFASIGPGECREFQVMAEVAQPGVFRHNARATSGRLTADASAGSTTVGQARLALLCSSPDRRFIGNDFCHEYTISNPGDCPANNVQLSVGVSGAAPISASDGGNIGGSNVTWTFASIPAGASRTVSICFDPASPGTISTRGSASGDCIDDRPQTECNTEIRGIPAVLLEVVDENDPVPVGSDEIYTITTTNQGSATDTNILITCQLEPNVTFVSAQGATSATQSGATVTFAPLPSLAPKARATWQIRVRGAQPGDTRFRVRMDTDNIQRPVEETEATNIYQ